MPPPDEAQSFSVKRAQVEFHNFASLGEPERAIAGYLDENRRRGSILRGHRDFLGALSPFLEIGANAGHTSYMLANEFGADGFALDISADALRHGIALMDRCGFRRAPVRVAGDAVNLPFRDGSLRFVMACQVLSQFMNIGSVFEEVKRVLAPGGVFLFTEEPLRRPLSLHLYRAPYPERMKAWERKLFKWGLLGYLARDVIGAEQEESFGIRQNHRMYLSDWRKLIATHFAAQRYVVFAPQRGWGERIVKTMVRTDWRTARLLGGTLAAFCRKAGEPAGGEGTVDRFEDFLRCPDCHGALARDAAEALACACGYRAASEGGVYNLLPANLRAELYPGDRADAIDFSLPGHEARLREGWGELDGDFGNRFRWIAARATAVLRPVRGGPRRLRVRGYAHEALFAAGQPVVELRVNGQTVARHTIGRVGLFIAEADLPDAEAYDLEILASPTFTWPDEDRLFSVNISMIRIVGPE
ncbi:MAG: methyltransferase domain-containing protein [Acidobacteriota bacterium]|nr:methyltransferase domain-containing protein [Acidobacteriota bacterium]